MGWECRQNIGDQAVGGNQFGIVERPEAAFMGDLVDPVVVSVDEPLTLSQLLADHDR